MKKLQQQTENQLDIPWSIILVVHVGEASKPKLIALLNDLMTKKPEEASTIHTVLYEYIQSNQLKMKYFEKDEKVFIQMQFNIEAI